MTSIARVEVQRIQDAPLPRPLHLAWDPGVVKTTDSFTVVRVFDVEGRMGVGEGGRQKDLRAAAEAVVGRQLADLVGADLTSPPRLALAASAAGAAGVDHADSDRQGTVAVFGLDVALWDLWGRRAGRSLAQLWGDRGEEVRAYAATVELGSGTQRAEDALGFAAEGFAGLKLRLHHPTIGEDLAYAATVRDAVGDQMALMADANQARAAQRGTAVRWSFGRAQDTARALHELGFSWLEEPLPLDRLDDLARLRDTTGMPIAGGERDHTVSAFAAMFASGAYDIVQPDGLVVGRLGPLLEIVNRAATAGVPCVFHHGGGGLAAYAHAHLAAGAAGSPWFEIIRDRPGEIPWPAQLVPLVPLGIDAAGAVRVGDGPGLGVDLDEAFLDRFTVSRTIIDRNGQHRESGLASA